MLAKASANEKKRFHWGEIPHIGSNGISCLKMIETIIRSSGLVGSSFIPNFLRQLCSNVEKDCVLLIKNSHLFVTAASRK